jgi:hypothetical protein
LFPSAIDRDSEDDTERDPHPPSNATAKMGFPFLFKRNRSDSTALDAVSSKVRAPRSPVERPQRGIAFGRRRSRERRAQATTARAPASALSP